MRPDKLTKHHRKPKHLGGKRNPVNISIIPWEKHCAWHVLFRDMTPEEIFKEINTRFIDPEYELVLIRTSKLPF